VFLWIEKRGKKMNYSDFEWKLCNRVFTDAVFMPKEYSLIPDYGKVCEYDKDNNEKLVMSYV